MKQADLSVLGPDWRSMGKKEASLKKYFPNRSHCNEKLKQVTIDVERSPRGDFALNERIVLNANEVEGWTCYVRLTERSGAFIAQDTLGNVWRTVKAIEPNEGEYGPYWWLTEDFELANAMLGSSSPL